jgi:transcriptional regulator with XRE-family HTH domain
VPNQPSDTLGGRVKELREECGLSQRQFAKELRCSVSWVSQVERGVTEVPKLASLQRMAAVLGVASMELVSLALGPDAGEEERQRDYVEVLRRALAGHPAPQEVMGETIQQAREIALDWAEDERRRAWELVHACDYEALGPLLAGLIPKLETASRIGDEATRRRALGLLAELYQVAAAMLVKAGDVGAGWVAADRAITVGERCGDRGLVMAAQYRMAHTFVHSSERSLALHVLRKTVGTGNELSNTSDPGLVSLTGACALLGAVMEARNGDAKEARHFLAVAGRYASSLGSDRNDYDTEFGPTNVALHQVAVEVELGNAGEALALARRVNAQGLSLERRARYLIDLARAHAQRHDVRMALATLLEVEAIAPGELAELRLVRELLADLEHVAKGTQLRALRALRRRVTHK